MISRGKDNYFFSWLSGDVEILLSDLSASGWKQVKFASAGVKAESWFKLKNLSLTLLST